MICLAISIFRRLCRDEQGAVVALTIVVFPFVTLFSAAILMSGKVFPREEALLVR